MITLRKSKLIIIGSGLILSAIVYSSFISLSKSNDHIKIYERYYNEDSTTEKDVDASDKGVPALAHDTDTNAITITKDATIDTNLNSIGLFVNKEYSLPEDYVPSDLIEPDVLFNITYSDEKKLLRSEAALALEKLFDAAKADGYSICGVSGYRSYVRQNSIYNRNLRTKGVDYTNRYSAKPGFSEHQTGLAIDVSASSIANRLSETFGDTKEGKWLAEHAHEYGFIIRYPKDKAELTGYAYEPWHIRYLGIELATYLYDNNMCLEEYYNYTPPVIDDNTDNIAVDVDDPDEIIEDLPSIIKDSKEDQKDKDDKDSKKDDKDNQVSDKKDKDTIKDKDTDKKVENSKEDEADKKPSTVKPSTNKKPSSDNTDKNNSSDKNNSTTKPDKKPGVTPEPPKDTQSNDSENSTPTSDSSNDGSDTNISGDTIEAGSEISDENKEATNVEDNH